MELEKQEREVKARVYQMRSLIQKGSYASPLMDPLS